MKIEFHHLCTGARSAIAYSQTHRNRLARGGFGRYFVRRHLQIAVIELRVGKTITEGEEWVDLLLVEISVAHVDTLGVIDCKIFARIISVGWRILPLFHKRNRKLAGGIHVAKQNVSECVAAFLSAIPQVENGGNRRDPSAHNDWASGIDHYDGIFIRFCHSINQVVLSGGQIERLNVVVFRLEFRRSTNYYDR